MGAGEGSPLEIALPLLKGVSGLIEGSLPVLAQTRIFSVVIKQSDFSLPVLWPRSELLIGLNL